jgi:23S rRNA (adenine2030-N6)-methyltransferase
MLSYRHGFHAGNFADILKHYALSLVLDYLTQKDKPLTYIDTHAGAGMYSLSDEFAQKTGEYLNGINKLYQVSDLPESFENYVDLINELNANAALEVYPGSPSIAKNLLRQDDTAHFFELHPNDFLALAALFTEQRRRFTHNSDGYTGLVGLLPPPSRRALVLIDPPYEIKTDYQVAIKTLVKAYKSFNSGTYILWYPVVKRELIEQMELELQQSGIKNVVQLELALATDNNEFGMTSSGLFIVNPPWTLLKEMQQTLPLIQGILAPEHGFTVHRQLIAE